MPNLQLRMDQNLENPKTDRRYRSLRGHHIQLKLMTQFLACGPNLYMFKDGIIKKMPKTARKAFSIGGRNPPPPGFDVVFLSLIQMKVLLVSVFIYNGISNLLKNKQ